MSHWHNVLGYYIQLFLDVYMFFLHCKLIISTSTFVSFKNYTTVNGSALKMVDLLPAHSQSHPSWWWCTCTCRSCDFWYCLGPITFWKAGSGLETGPTSWHIILSVRITFDVGLGWSLKHWFSNKPCLHVLSSRYQLAKICGISGVF